MYYRFTTHNVPRHPESPRTLHLAPSYAGTYDLDTLCEALASSSTVTKGDVYAVMTNMVHYVSQALADGYVVDIAGLGRLRLTFSSDPLPAVGTVRVSDVLRRPHLLFHPARQLERRLARVVPTQRPDLRQRHRDESPHDCAIHRETPEP